MDREQLLARYGDYLDVCNRHTPDELAPFLANIIEVNGETQTAQQYQDNLATLFRSFPDYHWQLLRAVVEGNWLAVHLHDHGTRTGEFFDAPGDGASVETDEFAIYRFNPDGRIEHVEVTADNHRLTH